MLVTIFQAVFVVAEPFMNGIDWGVRAFGRWVGSGMAEGALRSLLVDGVIGGVGMVLAFLPQILILFAFLAVLEDCGYMARAAYLMDRLMARVGLSGKSFIPLLSSFACAVPGIMATRVIENHRDRLTTILVAPLMTCSARLPIYALLIAAFVPHQAYLGGLLNLQGLTLVGLYLLGMVAAVLVARLLEADDSPRRRAAVRHGTAELQVAVAADRGAPRAGAGPLVPPHRRHADPRRVDPRLGRPVLSARPRRGRGAGPRAARGASRAAPGPSPRMIPSERRFRPSLAELERSVAAGYQRQSYLGRFGRWIEPVFRPLGWDWRIGAAVIASFPARETVVATLGVIFNAGGDAEEGDGGASSEFSRGSATPSGKGATGRFSMSRWPSRSWSSMRSAPDAPRPWP